MNGLFNRIRNHLSGTFEKRLRAKTLRRVSDIPGLGTRERILPFIEHPETFFDIRTEQSPDIENIGRLCHAAHFGVYSRKWPEKNDGGCGRVRFRPRSFDVSAAPGQPRRWVLLQSRTLAPETFSISFDLVLRSVFTEFQFDFRIRHLARRCRFILLENRMLNFEIVDHGFFIRALRSVPLNLKLGCRHQVEVAICGNHFECRTDGKTAICVEAAVPWISGGPAAFAFILFERGTDKRIEASVSDLKCSGSPLPAEP